MERVIGIETGDTTDDNRLEEIVRDVWHEPETVFDLRVKNPATYFVTPIR